MGTQVESLPDVRVTAENVREFREQGFAFCRNFRADQIAESYRALCGIYGPDNVLVGQVATINDGQPRPLWHDGTQFSIYVRGLRPVPSR